MQWGLQEWETGNASSSFYLNWLSIDFCGEFTSTMDYRKLPKVEVCIHPIHPFSSCISIPTLWQRKKHVDHWYAITSDLRFFFTALFLLYLTYHTAVTCTSQWKHQSTMSSRCVENKKITRRNWAGRSFDCDARWKDWLWLRIVSYLSRYSSDIHLLTSHTG